MRTEQLIAELAIGKRPAGDARLRITFAVAVGWLVSLAGLFLILGPPLREIEHGGIASFAVKLGYTVALTSLSVTAAIAAGRPGRKLSGPAAVIILPFVILASIALLELGSVDASARREMLFGTDYLDCVLSVVLASVPVFVSLLWGYRILAPTRLPVAGFMIGLSSGAAGAVAFTLYCHETSAAFLVAAYSPAMLIPALIGAAGGRLFLKW